MSETIASDNYRKDWKGMENIVNLLFYFHISQKDIYRVKGVKLQLKLNLLRTLLN